MKFKTVNKITATGIAASLIMINGGCGGNNSSNISDNNPDNNLKKYNVMLILTDQEHYFSEYPKGSNYEARKLLAELGATFEKHYICSNMSTSSRSTIFTGHHVPDTGMTDNTDFPWQKTMSDSLRTIGDIMMEAGYYSALKGKWHLGGTADITGKTMATITSLDVYGFYDWGGTDYIGALHQGNEIDPLIASQAVEWLASKGKNLNSDGKPFFLMLTMINPHDIMDYDITGYESPSLHLGGKPDNEIYDVAYDNAIPSTYNFNLTAEDLPEGIKLYYNNWSILTGSFDVKATTETDMTINDLWKDYQDYYFNCIQDNDNNLMNVINALIDNEMLNDTIIIFTADHGEMHGSHGLKGKGGFVYENNVHVPMIIVHPDFKGGKKISAVTSHIDIAATLADIAGLTSENLPGKSLLPLLNGSKKSVRDCALFCYEMLSMSAPCVVSDDKVTYDFKNMGRGMMRSIITEDGYKFARYFSPREFNTPKTFEELFASNDVQLFDTNEDPKELNNLASPENRVANRELIMKLNEVMNNMIEKEIITTGGEHVLQPLKEYLNTLQNNQ